MSSQPAAAVRASASWRALGTPIRFAVTDPARLAAGRRLLTGYLAELDAACSRFRADSELARAERVAGSPMQVSEVLTDAVAVALDAAEITGGDLDPTMATAMAALGYDRDFGLVARDGPALPGAPGPRLAARGQPEPELPGSGPPEHGLPGSGSPEKGPPGRQLQGRDLPARAHSRSGPGTLQGWREIRLDRAARRLTLPRGIRLDLGATAKARAADRAADALAERLACGVLVSLGGDIAVRGQPPAGGWLVRVQDVTGHPDDLPAGPAQIIAVSAGGLATSGIAARQWRRGGVRLHHILDPRTGLPAEPVWRTVSVLAGTALNANIAATTAIIRGEQAAAWLERIGAAARLVAADGTVRTTAAWPQDTTPQCTTPQDAGSPPELVPA